jgi:hypothetical protein
MYYIRKYADCWAIHDDDTGMSRKLEKEEMETVAKEFPVLLDKAVRTVFMDTLTSIQLKLSICEYPVILK